MPQKTILAPEGSTSTIVDPIASQAPQSGASDLDMTHRCLTCRWRKDWNGTVIGAWTTEEERHSDPSDLAPVGERPVDPVIFDRLVNRANDWLSARPNQATVTATRHIEHDAISARVRAAGSSFFWATQLLPYHRREAMYAIYAFCREVDDIADGEASRALKEKLLSDWRTEISLMYAGQPRHVITRALSHAVCAYGLRCEDFMAVIDGMEMDARADIRAPSLIELDLYCERVAVAVGRLSVRIFGENTPAGERVAAELGRALQLTNILRDLVEAAGRNRLYLPRELLHAHGIFSITPSWVLAQPALPDVCRDLAMLAEEHYEAAAYAITACPRGRMRPAAVMFGVYRALLHALIARGWKHLDEPVRIPAWRKLALVLRHGLAGR
jgi:phytoene synthase